MRKSLLLVSAHNPVPRLSCTQLPRTSAPLTAQNLTPPVQPQPGRRRSQSSGVVAHDLVALDHQAADTAAGLVRVHAVLAVVAQAAGADLLAGTGHQPGAGVVLDRRVLDHPPVGRVVVDHALVVRRDETLHGQVADGDVAGGAAERVLVVLPAVEHRARRAEVAVPLLGDDLGVAVRLEPVLARPKPERGVRGAALGLRGQVTDHRGVDRHRARRRLRRPGRGLGAHPGHGRGRRTWTARLRLRRRPACSSQPVAASRASASGAAGNAQCRLLIPTRPPPSRGT